ncbi:hypothetical protein ACFLXF_00780 [Chloroflexota bacterium]
MKLGKTSLLIIVLGIFIIVFGSLGLTRSQQVEKKSQLEDEIAIADTRLSNLQLKELYTQKEELEEELNDSLSQLEVARAVLRQSIESANVTESLFQIASASGVEIASISSSGISEGELDGIKCSVVKLTIGVVGDLPNLISYVTRLNTDLTTGLVTSTQIGVSSDTQEEMESEATEEEEEEEGTGEEEEELGNTTANIQLIIYSYEGN